MGYGHVFCGLLHIIKCIDKHITKGKSDKPIIDEVIQKDVVLAAIKLSKYFFGQLIKVADLYDKISPIFAFMPL